MNPSRSQSDQPLRLSVLDRLVQGDKSESYDAFAYSKSRADLETALRRDLEWLFNTRYPVQHPPEGATELETSVYCFGLPDVCTMNLSNVRNRSSLAHLMEAAIALHEPRLSDVRVIPISAPPGGLPRLGFTIEAKLLVEPIEEDIRFDAELKVAEGQYLVKDEL